MKHQTLAEVYQEEFALRHSLASKISRIESDLHSLKQHGLVSEYVYNIIIKDLAS